MGIAIGLKEMCNIAVTFTNWSTLKGLKICYIGISQDSAPDGQTLAPQRTLGLGFLHRRGRQFTVDKHHAWDSYAEFAHHVPLQHRG